MNGEPSEPQPAALVIADDTGGTANMVQLLEAQGFPVRIVSGRDESEFQAALNRYPGVIFYDGSRDGRSEIETGIREFVSGVPILVVYLQPGPDERDPVDTLPFAVLPSGSDGETLIELARSGFRYRESLLLTNSPMEPFSATICAWCHRLQRSQSANPGWQPVSEFFRDSPACGLSHGICDICSERLMAEIDVTAPINN